MRVRRSEACSSVWRALDSLTTNVEVQGRGAALSRSVPWNDGFGVLGGKLDDLERFTPLLGVPQVVLHLLAKPTLGAGVKGDG